MKTLNRRFKFCGIPSPPDAGQLVADFEAIMQRIAQANTPDHVEALIQISQTARDRAGLLLLAEVGRVREGAPSLTVSDEEET